MNKIELKKISMVLEKLSRSIELLSIELMPDFDILSKRKLAPQPVRVTNKRHDFK